MKKFFALLVVGLLFLGCATTKFEGFFKMRDGSVVKFDNAQIKMSGRVATIKTKMGETKIQMSDVEAIEVNKDK